MSSVSRRILIFLWVGAILGIIEADGNEADPGRARDQIQPSPACFFSGGHWYDGEQFKRASFWSVNGIFTSAPQDDSTCRVDLGDWYLIPPLGEAHIHSLNDAAAIAEQIAFFMKKGVFYAMVQGAIFEIGPEIRNRINRPDTVDAVYAQGTMAAPWYGTLQDIHQSLLDAGMFGDRKTLSELDTREIFLIETAADLNAKWDRQAAKNRHIVKVLLAFSDEFKERRSQVGPNPKPQPGIDPALLPGIVQRAHAVGLRVSTHVDTAADVAIAVEAGVDIIAHLPGWRIGTAAGYPEGDLAPFRISELTARQAAIRGVVVVTTTTPKSWLPNFEESLPRFRQLHRFNIDLLRRHGVTIVLGSDSRQQLVTAEIKHLAGLGIFDPPTLLKLATETTPQFIFPNRKIGRLAEGYEASFLALEGNPLEDLENLEKISLSVKQGYIVGAGETRRSMD